MGLLWKEDNPCVPFNRPLAEARLNHIKKRLLRDPQLKAKYRATIDDYVDRGYARKLSQEEANSRSNVTWFLPHHPVLNPNKPDKVRIVFDAAARFQGTSLNSHLLHGPNLANNLVGVILRFRRHKVALAADIEAMFYQVKVISKDTDALRFLWWSEGFDQPPEDYKMLVHIFGAASSPGCANKALKVTASDNADKYHPEVIHTVERDFYIDDLLTSVPAVSKAVWLTEQSRALLAEGGFR